jgi:glycosyltransferase involved in cell wall biosynthesis
MNLSLIVCTRNRAPQLAEALPHFSRLSFPPHSELILVDNGSNDGTDEIIATFARTADFAVRIVSEPRPGLSVARNAGLRAAAGNILVFTDDDCYPEPDYPIQIVACFEERAIGYLGGRILLWDKQDLPITIQPLAERVDIAPRSFVKPGLIHGANMSFKREVFDAVGFFDELLGIGTPLHCGEDLDLLARASAAGFPGAYDPRPTVFHHHRRSRPEDARRLLAGYDIGRGALYAKAMFSGTTRTIYLWPYLRRIAGSMIRRDFDVLKREIQGARAYMREANNARAGKP